MPRLSALALVFALLLFVGPAPVNAADELELGTVTFTLIADTHICSNALKKIDKYFLK